MRARPRISPETKLAERCAVLAEVVRAMKTVYSAPDLTPTQKDLLETMIGAAIWYMPQSNDLWTGKISVEALKARQAGAKPCKDHDYPRKLAGRDLLHLDEHDLTGPNLLLLYKTKYGRFNYVTQTENKRLVQHQKVHRFTSSEEAYKNAGIRLLGPSDLESIAATVSSSHGPGDL